MLRIARSVSCGVFTLVAGLRLMTVADVAGQALPTACGITCGDDQGPADAQLGPNELSHTGVRAARPAQRTSHVRGVRRAIDASLVD